MKKVILFLFVAILAISCCPKKSNAQEEGGDSKLGLHLQGEHELLKVDGGYFRFDNGYVYFTWKGNDDKWHQNDMAWNQVIIKDTTIKEPFIKFRWKPDNDKYNHLSFDEGYVFFVLLYIDVENIDDLYIKEKLIQVIKEHVEEEPRFSADEYLYEY